MNLGTNTRDVLLLDELEKLRELRSVVDQSALLLQLSAKCTVTEANEKFVRVAGYAHEQIFRLPFSCLLETAFRNFFAETVLPTLSRGITWRGELCFQAKNGLHYWTETTIVPILDSARRVCHFHMVAFEISERKAVETALRNNAVFFTRLMELAPIGFFLADEAGNCTYINKVWSELSGLRLRQALGDGWLAGVYPEDRALVEAAWRRFVGGSESFKLEYRYQPPGAEISWVSAAAERIDLSPEGKISYIRAENNITERLAQDQLINEQRAQMVAASKMCALGEMAGGIAHEINNPLAILQLRARQIAYLTQSGHGDPEKLVEAADNIRSTTERIAAIIRSLRAISREGHSDPFLLTPLRDLIDHTLELCAARFRFREIRLEVEAFDPALQIRCRSVEILQILLSLLSNSMSAVEELKEKWVRITVQTCGGDVEIWVTDSGTGIDHDVRRRLFQPFFSTKPVGSGTGLGLSISRAAALDHGGDLFLDLRSPHTRFVLRLPLPIASLPHAKQTSPLPPEVSH